LDLDTIDDDERSRRNFADVIPAALRSSRQSVTGLMKQKGSSKRFKLDGLVDAACEPLEKLLGQKKHFFGEDGMSSLDCLALGYLALAVTPDVPQKWLAEGLRDRWPGLRAFVRRGVGEGFGGLVRVEDALMGGNLESVGGKGLPWRATTQTGLSAAGTTLLNSALAALPFPQTTILTTPSKQQSTNSSSNNTPPSSSTSTLLPTLLAASTAVTAAAGYFLYASLNAEEEKRSLGDMGEAGAMLAGLDFGGRGERGRGKGREREVGVEVQEKGM